MMQLFRLFVDKKTRINEQGQKEEFTQTYTRALSGHAYNDINDLFANAPSNLKDDEKINVFYTVAHHELGTRSRKAWQAQEIIPFDLDGINLDRIDEYAPAACEALGIDINKVGVVYTGNGVHILVKVAPFTGPEFIKKNKHNYQALYNKIISKLEALDLPITRDTTAWDYARILRLPGTINQKYKKNEAGELILIEKECRLINGAIEEQVLNFPAPAKEENNLALRPGSFPIPDKDTIINECEFFKWLKDNPGEVHEPHAYAMLSITCHFDDNNLLGKELWTSFSSPSINSKDVVELSEQAKVSSGPRTCEGVNNIWGKCNTCPHYKKTTSPILLKSADYVGTESLGFSTRSPKGGITRDFKGLSTFMSKELFYKVLAETNDLYIFNGTYYEKISESFVKSYAETHFLTPVKERERAEFLAQVKVTNLLNGEDEINFINAKNCEGFINFKNGILAVETGQMYPHGPNFHFHYCLPYDYSPSATAPHWLAFMNQITLGREDLINILHEYIGYVIYGGEYAYHKALILSGSGKNGKSTYVTTLRNLVGSMNAGSVALTSITTNPFMLAELQNKLVNISEEEPPSCFKETGIFKNITGNNTVIAQRKFKPPFSMLSKAKIIITYNEMPFISDTTTGMRRRLLIVPFDLDLENSPDKVDIKIQSKLNKELPGIFNLALEGYKRLVSKGGFTRSSCVDDAVAELMESNPFYSWLDEEMIIEQGAWKGVSCKEAYEAYLDYTKGFGYGGGQVYGFRKFGLELKKKKVISKPVREGNKVRKIYEGLSFIEQGNIRPKF